MEIFTSFKLVFESKRREYTRGTPAIITLWCCF